MTSFLFVVFLILSFVGFAIATYISNKKSAKKPLMCRKPGDCNDVVNSTYATFLGFPVVELGKRYYMTLGVVSAILLVLPGFRSPSLMIALVFVTLSGLLFSLYLVGVQVFAIKKFCMWCMGSATVALLLFMTALFMALS